MRTKSSDVEEFDRRQILLKSVSVNLALVYISDLDSETANQPAGIFVLMDNPEAEITATAALDNISLHLLNLTLYQDRKSVV